MNKTKVDDMLIEMISPKVKEIEEKFAQGKGLTQDDINTLLLKSQYNHINHLDQKLDEVTDDVASLKGEFNNLRGEFNGLRGEFNNLRGEFNGLRGELNGKFNEFREEFNGKLNDLRKEFNDKFNGLQGEFNDLRTEFHELKGEFEGLRKDFALLKSDIEATIQKALNRNMMLLVTVMGTFVILSKLVDKI